MAAAALPAAVGFSAVSSIAQFGLQRTAAEGIKGEASLAAKAEELAATSREADRKSSLAVALASQIAESGAKGVSAFEGSPLTIIEADIKAEAGATQRDIFQTRISALTKREKGKIQSRQIKTGANIGLLSDTGKLAALAAPS